jgi:hypothetical protein
MWSLSWVGAGGCDENTAEPFPVGFASRSPFSGFGGFRCFGGAKFIVDGNPVFGADGFLRPVSDFF